MRPANDHLGRSQHRSRAVVVARNAKTQTMVFVRAAMWGMSDMLSPVDLAGWEAVFDQNGIRGLHMSPALRTIAMPRSAGGAET